MTSEHFVLMAKAEVPEETNSEVPLHFIAFAYISSAEALVESQGLGKAKVASTGEHRKAPSREA